MNNVAIIIVDLEQGRFGHRAGLLDELAGKRVLQHTIDRAARIDGLDAIVLIHPEGQPLGGKYQAPAGGPPISTQQMQTRPGDAWLQSVIGSGRKWSLTAWRGGIGGATVYDELLPAYPLTSAAQQCGAESLVILRGDWCCFDPALVSKQLERHRSAPESMKLVFSQAPPGLGALVIHHTLLAELAENSATIANLICYNPKKPVVDPVGKDVNIQVPASVRDQYRRFIYDTPRAVDHLRALAEAMGDGFAQADAAAITDASRGIETQLPWRQFECLPQQVNIELTPRRAVNGPIVPQHYIGFERGEMSAKAIDALLDQLPTVGDASVLFGGLGDALLHRDWFATLGRATKGGLLGVGVETDLLAEPDEIDKLAGLPLDVISVRLNADCGATYTKVMGVDRYAQVFANLQALFRQRNTNRQENKGFRGWIVPRFVKVNDNLSDLETFFERWMTVSGWAVIDRALTGRGLMPDLGPVPMEVPRPPDRAIRLHRQKQRLTVLSDGKVCLCGQDWLGRLPLGDVTRASLSELWRGAGALADEPGDLACVCPVCREWLEAQRVLMSSAGV